MAGRCDGAAEAAPAAQHQPTMASASQVPDGLLDLDNMSDFPHQDLADGANLIEFTPRSESPPPGESPGATPPPHPAPACAFCESPVGLFKCCAYGCAFLEKGWPSGRVRNRVAARAFGSRRSFAPGASDSPVLAVGACGHDGVQTQTCW